MQEKDEIWFARAIKMVQTKYFRLQSETILDIKSHCEIITAKQGEILVKQSNRYNKIYFIVAGALRVYFIQKEKPFTLGFAFENTFVDSSNLFFHDRYTEVCIDALENSILIGIDKEKVKALCSNYHEIETLSLLITNEHLRRYQKQMMIMLSENAAERYKSLLELYPFLLERVPLRYIASNLGISFETLSRIRGKERKVE